MLTVGTVSDFTGLIIPPNAEKFTADYACRKECTNVMKIIKISPDLAEIKN